jgi:hypothetical protein
VTIIGGSFAILQGLGMVLNSDNFPAQDSIISQNVRARVVLLDIEPARDQLAFLVGRIGERRQRAEPIGLGVHGPRLATDLRAAGRSADRSCVRRGSFTPWP